MIFLARPAALPQRTAMRVAGFSFCGALCTCRTAFAVWREVNIPATLVLRFFHYAREQVPRNLEPTSTSVRAGLLGAVGLTVAGTWRSSAAVRLWHFGPRALFIGPLRRCWIPPWLSSNGRFASARVSPRSPAPGLVVLVVVCPCCVAVTRRARSVERVIAVDRAPPASVRGGWDLSGHRRPGLPRQHVVTSRRHRRSAVALCDHRHEHGKRAAEYGAPVSRKNDRGRGNGPGTHAFPCPFPIPITSSRARRPSRERHRRVRG